VSNFHRFYQLHGQRGNINQRWQKHAFWWKQQIASLMIICPAALSPKHLAAAGTGGDKPQAGVVPTAHPKSSMCRKCINQQWSILCYCITHYKVANWLFCALVLLLSSCWSKQEETIDCGGLEGAAVLKPFPRQALNFAGGSWLN